MRKILSALCMLVAGLFAAPAHAALTDAQYQTLATHIRANTDPVVVAARAIRNDAAIADWYNGPGTCVVWRTSIRPDEYREAIVWTAVDSLTTGKARIWSWVTADMTLPVDATKLNIRQGIAEAWGAGSATGVALTTLAKRTATRWENMWTSGTCTTVTPGALGIEGALSVNDVSRSLNDF